MVSPPEHLSHPPPFLELLVHDIDQQAGLTGLCAGFEGGAWRAQQLARHVTEWLPEFALRYDEIQNLGHANALRLIEKAAQSLYATDKYKNRGEFGELLLHIALRKCFKTLPAVSKLYFKDGPNETVKGFDAVHVIANEKSLELWLGEVKFYQSASKAIGDVVNELEAHTQRDYLRREFVAISNKIDPAWPHRERLLRLLDRNTSLDVVFDVLCIPILLTYESSVVRAAPTELSTYRAKIEGELRRHFKSLQKKLPTCAVRVHLFLLPMDSKAVLVDCLHKELCRWQ